MPISIAEEIAALFYESAREGYVVVRNVPFLGLKRGKQPGNIDIDVLAIGRTEAFLVSCKRGSLDTRREKEELVTFQRAEDFLRKSSKYRDLLKKVKIRRVYVAEYLTKRNEQFFRSNNVDPRRLDDVFMGVVNNIRNQMGPRELEGMETSVLARAIKFMIKHDIFSRREGKGASSRAIKSSKKAEDE